MGNIENTTIILGSLRYKSASNIDNSIRIPLKQSFRENVEYDRTVDVNLAQVYDDERQKSDTIRPSFKVSLIFKNAYRGESDYPPFTKSLFYENVSVLSKILCEGENISGLFYSGYPQYYEFDFIRTDDDILGYTKPDSNGDVHIKFNQRDASTYNWMTYLTYAYDNDYNRKLSAIDDKTGIVLNWTASDGIPFIIDRNTVNGMKEISFRCPVNHGISVGDYIKLSFKYNGNDVFLVSSLGNGYYDSDKTIVNIIDVGFVGTTFDIKNTGTLRRVIDSNNVNDTISTYYVRRHKVLTKSTDAVITRTGFENTIYNKVRRNEKAIYTPNNQSRMSLKEGNNVYNIVYNKDIKINELRDNLNLPITKLYNTIIWRGYFGWTFGTPKLNGGYYGLKQGFEFNLKPRNKVTKSPNDWWNNKNVLSDTNLPLGTYTNPQGIAGRDFTYVKFLNEGDIIDGDLCEWNVYDLKERVISENYHKIKYNVNYFSIDKPSDMTSVENYNNPLGFYYKPHHSVTIREFSNYVEEGKKNMIDGIPDYSVYSNRTNLFRWRDIYTYGYIDEKGNGVDYPFFNGVHYPYKDIIFRLIPEGTTNNNTTSVSLPINDDCE